MTIRTLLFIALLSVAASVQAGHYNDEIDAFFELYEGGKVVEAVDRVYSTNPWINRKSDAVTKVKNQLSGLGELVGTYLGKERIGELKISERMAQVTYLALYQRQPVRMEFQFYRPADDWIVYSFSYDDNIDDELKNAARDRIVRGE